MKRKLVLKLTSVGMLIVTGMVGCSPSVRTAHPQVALADFSPKQFGQHAADRAAASLAAHDSSGAITAAEIAVASAPERADYRALLGQAYLAGGRFASAEQAFGGAIQIDPANSKAAFGHVLALIGEGRTDIARAALDALPTSTPAADRGLALALSGDRKAAVSLLEAAARAPGADARTRQNLALAYALSGDWAKASATAQQDVAAGDLPARLSGWAQFASAASPADQVAMLLGTVRMTDAGVPAQVALTPHVPAPSASPVAIAVATAPHAAPVLIAAPAPTVFAPLLLAAAEPAPFARVPMAPVAPIFHAPLLNAPTSPYKRSVIVAQAPHGPLRTVATPLLRVASGGRFVVQLGAFRDPSRVERAWVQSTTRVARLASYTPSSTTFLAAERSAAFTRLSIAGFANRAAAVAVCSAVKGAGGSCFVRAEAGDNPVHWASRETDKRA